MSKKVPVTHVQKSVPAEIWVRFPEVRVLRRVEEDPGTSMWRILAAEDIGVALIWRILHEQSRYPYHIQQVQALTPPDCCARAVFCQWHLAKCIVNTQFVAIVLFSDNAGFTRDRIVNSHNTHVWADDNPHTTVASRHQHRFSHQCPGGHLMWSTLRTSCLT
jgi:hypothetical protein